MEPCLKFGYTFAIFKAVGNSPDVNDFLVTSTNGSTNSSLHIFNSLPDILSYPDEVFSFIDWIMFNISSGCRFKIKDTGSLICCRLYQLSSLKSIVLDDVTGNINKKVIKMISHD